MESYEYPEILYCSKCNDDVDCEIETTSDVLVRDDGEKFMFEYRVAVCPKCKNVLCARDREYEMAKAIMKHTKQKN